MAAVAATTAAAGAAETVATVSSETTIGCSGSSRLKNLSIEKIDC